MKYLKYWRFVRGKTQKEIADLAEISQGHYCDIEKRGKVPTPEVCKSLASALDRPIEELVSKLNGVDPSDFVLPGSSAK